MEHAIAFSLANEIKNQSKSDSLPMIKQNILWLNSNYDKNDIISKIVPILHWKVEVLRKSEF